MVKLRSIYILLFSLLFTPIFSQNPVIIIETLEWNSDNDPALIQDVELIKNLSNEHISFKGGLILKANDRDEFGGLSALWVSKNGKELLAVSDYSSKLKYKDEYKSQWFQFDLIYSEKHNLINAEINKKGQFFNPNGQVISGEIESIAWNQKNFYLSFDGTNEVFSYDMNGFKNDEISSLPQSILHLNPNFPKIFNGGIEAMTLTRDNLLLAIYEKNEQQLYRDAWLLNPRTDTCKYFKYFTDLEDVKGATTLLNGDLIVLEKSYDSPLTRLKLCLINKNDLGSEEIRAQEILYLESEALDNFEGIASYSLNGKEYLLIISDDNGDRNTSQETLLLHFELLLNNKK
ncbi:esterase-like activity of phytase family protein [Bacteroidota bacterium]